MDVDLQQRLFAGIVDNLRNNTSGNARGDVAHDGSTYYDPDHLKREQALLRRVPQVAGHSDSLREPNSYVAHDRLGVPVLIARQADGTLKAFLNICRHRGAQLCAAGTGAASAFACPYHGWTYTNAGRLRGPGRTEFPNLTARQGDLVELPVEERHGLIWLVATPGATIDVAAHLGELDRELAAFRLGDLRLEREAVVEADINWKFVLDGFLEVYHIPKLHAGTIAPFFFGKHGSFEPLGPHGRLIGVRKSFPEIADKPFQEKDFLRHIAVNYLVFPNSIFVWQGDHFELWTSYPTDDPARCRVLIQSLCEQDMTGGNFTRRWDKNWKILIGTVEAEDWAISREVQENLPHLPDGRVNFGANEPGLQHFHGELERNVRPPA